MKNLLTYLFKNFQKTDKQEIQLRKGEENERKIYSCK